MLKSLLILVLSLFFATIQADAEITPNQAAVLLQLQSITTSPTVEEAAILNAFGMLEFNDLLHSLNQMSGEQFTTLAIANEIAGTQFLRSLFNPIRLTVITSPCPYTCCGLPTMGIWIQGGGGQSFINNCKHASDTLANHYTLSLGAQTIIDRDWTLGIAASIAENSLNYRHDGNGSNRYGFAGLYGLYRPIGYYVFADLIFGAERSRLTRKGVINELRYSSFSHPRTCQILGYIEAGMDCPLWNLLVQPFLGLEANGLFNKQINEQGNSPLNLTISNHNHGNVYSRLGAHITMDQCCFLLTLDLVWKYRLNPANHRINAHFQLFGEKFSVKDVKRGQSFFESALAITTNFCHGFDLFAEASGFVGYHSSSYQILAGMEYKW